MEFFKNLKPGDTFTITYCNQEIEFVRLTKKSAVKKVYENEYTWKHTSTGKPFTNRQQDVERWVKFKCIVPAEIIEEL